VNSWQQVACNRCSGEQNSAKFEILFGEGLYQAFRHIFLAHQIDLEVHGFDHTELKGGTLGIYLLFDNRHHIATSVYLLNQQPLTRRFQTIEQYRNLRTRFLATYTGCIAQNQSLQTPATKDGR